MTTGIGRFAFEATDRRLDLRWSGDRVEVRENLP
jgi:hypothetical protein